MTNREQELLIGWTIAACDGDFSEESVRAAITEINYRLSEPLNHAEILEIGAAVIGLDIKINLFVYGTFLDEKLFESVVGHPAPFEDDALKDYLRIDVGDNYDTLSPEEGRAVYGHRILVSASDLAKTDKWEKDYVRKPVVLASGNEADAYFLREGVHIGNYTVP